MATSEEQGDSVPSHLFVELTSLAELSFPTTASSRIKYTCVCASPHILAVGSSSGTVYLFSRYAAKNRKSLCNVPVQVIPCQEGAITLVEISPDEKCVAVATSRGFICVLNISRNHSTMILNSVLHIGSEITCFRFTLNGSRLFAGDSLGRISCSKLSSKLSLRSPCELILRLDSRVVQIDHFQSQLLVSTLSRSYLHNLARQTTCQIGSKLRNGIYGACFFTTDAGRDGNDPSISEDGGMVIGNYSPLIFCARPGGRLWEVDNQGKVYSTHQFGSIRNVWSVAGFREFSATSVDNAASISFSAINVVSEFILSAGGRTLTLVDPKRGKLVLVADVGEDIAQFHICANDVFLLTVDGYLRKVTLFPLEKAIEKLQYREKFNAAAQVACAAYEADKSYRFRLDTLRDIRARLDGLPEAVVLAQKLDAIISEVATKSTDSGKVSRVPQVARLASGIHKVVKGMENSGYEDDFTFRMPGNRRERNSRERALSRSPYNSLTRRSKSTPSVKQISAASGSGNGELFVDVPLDGEVDKVSATYEDGNGGSDFTSSKNYSTNVDCGMNVSRSEESLAGFLDDKRCQDYEESEFCGENGHERKRSASPFSHGNRQAGANFGRLETKTASIIDRKSNGNHFFLENYSIVDDPLAITPAALKETLKTGGKFLMEAVQKMSLLNMGPDFGDPAFFVNGSNGFYQDDEEEYDDSEAEPGRTVVHDVVFDQLMGNHQLSHESAESTSQKPLAETPVVQRVIRPTSARIKRMKTSGKPNGCVAADHSPSTEASMRTSSTGRQQLFSSGMEDETIVNASIPKPVRLLRCEHCGLHNTWRYILTVGPMTSSLKLSLDCYKEGGVPVDRNSWKELITEWKRVRLTSASTSALCVDCSRLFASWFHRHDTLNMDPYLTEPVSAPDLLEPHLATVPEATLARIFGATERSRCLDESKRTIGESDTTICVSSEKIIDSSVTPSPTPTGHDPSLTREEEAAMAVSMYYNPLYESVYNSDGVLDLSSKDIWRWLSAVPLDILLTVGAKILGLETMISILSEMEAQLGGELSETFFRFVSRPSDIFKTNPKVLEAVALGAFNLTGVCLDDTDNKAKHRAIRIDVRDFCPCCTLPLTSTVAETDQRIFIFNCGHSYHKICLLSHAKPPYSCLVCTIAPL